jgi:hypothetical protein
MDYIIARWTLATLFACSFLTAGNAVQGKWPEGLKPTISCKQWRSEDLGPEGRIVNASGIVEIDSSEPVLPRLEITVGVRARLTSLVGTRTPVANVKLRSLAKGASNVFATDFDHSRITPNEAIES